MNAEWITFHLREAAEQIEQTLRQLPDADYDEDYFRVDVQHMLHIHTAWNSRDVPDPWEHTEEEFREYRRPPADMDWE